MITNKMLSLDPGELEHFIEIQQATEMQDAAGALLQSWAKYAQVWASIDPYGGGERWADGTTVSTNVIKIKMRYCPGISTKMRVAWNGRVFDIKIVENVMERGAVHVLTCIERLYDEAGTRVQ